MARPPAYFVTLLHEALLKSFNRKKALRQFLRSSGVSERTLAQWHEDETKRDWLDKLIPSMLRSEQGCILVQRMGRELAQQSSFPDLRGFEESERLLVDAKAAVHALQQYLAEQEIKAVDEKEQQARRVAAAEQRSASVLAKGDLAALTARFDSLVKHLGTQEGGFSFETWFFDLVAFGELDHRRPFRADGRQIDGSITADGTTYLVETKFTSDAANPKDVSDFYRKVVKKADNTMGLFVSVSGYSQSAIAEAKGERSPLLLMQVEHILHVLRATVTLGEVIRRVRRHASQTGEPLLLPRDF